MSGFDSGDWRWPVAKIGDDKGGNGSGGGSGGGGGECVQFFMKLNSGVGEERWRGRAGLANTHYFSMLSSECPGTLWENILNALLYTISGAHICADCNLETLM